MSNNSLRNLTPHQNGTSSYAGNDSSSVFINNTGPKGDKGDKGDIGDVVGADSVKYRAVGAIGGQRVVRSNGSKLVSYADNTNVLHAPSIVGITVNAAIDGAEIAVKYEGEITDPTWTWTPNLPVFCGTNGTMTQTVPLTGFQLILGVATSANTLLLAIKQPLLLL